MQRNTASQVVGAQMISAADGSAFTGSVTCYVTVDGGTQAQGSVGSGACTHAGNGFHTYSPAQAETDGAHLAFTFIGTGAVPVTVQVYTTSPQSGDAFARLGAPDGASVSADIAALASDMDAAGLVVAQILEDTGTTIPGILGTPAGASISDDIAALPTDADVNAQVDAALADYDAPTKGELDAAVAPLATASALETVDSNVDTLLDRLVGLSVTTGEVVADEANTASAFATDLSETADDHWVGAYLLITSGALAGQVRRVTGYNGTGKVMTTAAFTAAPASGVTFAIINR